MLSPGRGRINLGHGVVFLLPSLLVTSLISPIPSLHSTGPHLVNLRGHPFCPVRTGCLSLLMHTSSRGLPGPWALPSSLWSDGDLYSSITSFNALCDKWTGHPPVLFSTTKILKDKSYIYECPYPRPTLGVHSTN